MKLSMGNRRYCTASQSPCHGGDFAEQEGARFKRLAIPRQSRFSRLSALPSRASSRCVRESSIINET